VVATACDVQTKIWHFPTFLQKGFTGTCTYHLQGEDRLVAWLTRLAAFAFYAGIGYKTSMGMGQVRPDLREER
jgi:CRISPR-associated endoribonuclease Cas6